MAADCAQELRRHGVSYVSLWPGWVQTELLMEYVKDNKVTDSTLKKMDFQVCVVTGASRGIGRGIALQLCEAGATVYITGRHQDTLKATAQEAQARGGRCVPVVCDSSQESEVQSLFEQVNREQQGRLDVLVNNAYGGVQVGLEL